MSSGGHVRASYDWNSGVGNITCAFDYLLAFHEQSDGVERTIRTRGSSTKTGNWRCLRLYSLHTDSSSTDWLLICGTCLFSSVLIPGMILFTGTVTTTRTATEKLD